MKSQFILYSTYCYNKQLLIVHTVIQAKSKEWNRKTIVHNRTLFNNRIANSSYSRVEESSVEWLESSSFLPCRGVKVKCTGTLFSSFSQSPPLWSVFSPSVYSCIWNLTFFCCSISTWFPSVSNTSLVGEVTMISGPAECVSVSTSNHLTDYKNFHLLN